MKSRRAWRNGAPPSAPREYVVSEIFLALDDPAREGEVRTAADGIAAQLRAGASFAGLARQFSQSSSAAIGGDLGRVRAGRLDARLETALDSLAPNGISSPIRLENGFYILLLRERSVVEGAKALEEKLALKRLYFAAPEAPGRLRCKRSASGRRQSGARSPAAPIWSAPLPRRARGTAGHRSAQDRRPP